MTLISKKIESELIDGQTWIRTERIKQIISDINSDSGFTKQEIFLLGLELGRLYEFEVEHTTEVGLCAEISNCIDTLTNNI